MINRIQTKFKQLKNENKKALIVYIMAGDPTINLTEKFILALEKCGVDIIELGVPFSDPLADGRIIQQADTRTLKKGINIKNVLALTRRLRKKTQIPLVLMLYYNLILNFGEERFIREAEICGIDGVIVPDLPVEEAHSLINIARCHNLTTIFFVTPTSSLRRMKLSASKSTGFIYYISRTGVTGKKTRLSSELKAEIKEIRKITNKPICVGFGIRSASQVAKIKKIADGVIVGSAIVEEISKHSKNRAIVDRITRFVRGLNV